MVGGQHAVYITSHLRLFHWPNVVYFGGDPWRAKRVLMRAHQPLIWALYIADLPPIIRPSQFRHSALSLSPHRRLQMSSISEEERANRLAELANNPQYALSI